MRVVLVSQEFPPETGWGGIGTYVDVLGEALAALGVDVHVLSTVAGQQASTTVVDGVTVHRFPLPSVRGFGRLTGAPETLRRLRTAFSVARLLPGLPSPATIECPEWMAEGLALALRHSVPLVVRLHSSARQLFRYTRQGRGIAGWDGRGAMALEELAVRRADVVTSTASNLAASQVTLGLDAAATRAIALPMRLPQMVPLDHGGPARVVFVGRLEPRKGPEKLLAAAPIVLAANPGARFTFVGRDGTEPGAPSSSRWLLQEAARLGVAEAVDLTGPLDACGVRAQLQAATVAVFPSQWESFGYAAAEAAAVGRPVVTSDIAGFGEFVRHGITGYRVPEATASGLADAVGALLADRSKARVMGEAGARIIREHCDPRHVAEQTISAHEAARERWAQRGRRR